MNILYSLISFDGYPDCMLPAISYSPYFLIYFLSYLTLYVLIFLPVPVAVVFEAFRVIYIKNITVPSEQISYFRSHKIKRSTFGMFLMS